MPVLPQAAGSGSPPDRADPSAPGTAPAFAAADAARNGWVGDYSDASNMLDLLYSTNGNNDGKYNNPEFDAAIELSRTTTDEAARFEALHTAEDILMDEAACIPVAYYNDFWLQSEKITGSWHSAYGYWHLMYADIAE